MILLIDLLATVLAFLGHFSLCVWVFNRLHARPWPRPRIKAAEQLVLLFAGGVVAIFALRALMTGSCVWQGEIPRAAELAWLAYPAFCGLIALLAVPMWVVPKLRERVPAALLSNDTTHLDLALRLGKSLAGTPGTRLCAALPGNEIFHIAIQRKTLHLPRLPEELEGLSIAHLSDLHMTGRVTRPYYDEMVELTNAQQPDVIVITGDICEKVACLEWIVPTLGRLRAKEGKFFVLGNHELKLPDVSHLRRLMEQAGFVDVASQSRLVPLRGREILLAGTEMPWFGSLPNDLPSVTEGLFRLLLSHTPDLLPWAKASAFDLMLAGHNHGGQIRLPIIGPLIAPSNYGFRYAGGLYYEEPTLLHVSRGLGGLHPVRLNCPPELPILILTGRAS